MTSSASSISITTASRPMALHGMRARITPTKPDTSVTPAFAGTYAITASASTVAFVTRASPRLISTFTSNAEPSAFLNTRPTDDAIKYSHTFRIAALAIASTTSIARGRSSKKRQPRETVIQCRAGFPRARTRTLASTPRRCARAIRRLVRAPRRRRQPYQRAWRTVRRRVMRSRCLKTSTQLRRHSSPLARRDVDRGVAPRGHDV